MPSINLYVHVLKDGTISPSSQNNIKRWPSFFREYLPEWDLRLKLAEQILTEEPDHILFPGGRASKFMERLGSKNMKEITTWVERGGSYIGVCAGAYLACDGKLNITTLKRDPLWQRGNKPVKIEVNDTTHKFDLNQVKGNALHLVSYRNGPIFNTILNSEVEVWAQYKDEYSTKEGHYPMLESPAITYNKFGDGHVTLFSPHLESSKGQAKEVLAKLFDKIDKLYINKK